MYVKVSGSYRKCCEGLYVKVSGTYMQVSRMFKKALGEWKEYDLSCHVSALPVMMHENYNGDYDPVHERMIMATEQYNGDYDPVYERATMTEGYEGSEDV